MKHSYAQKTMLIVCILISLASCSRETEFGTKGKWQKYDQDDVAMFFYDKSSVAKIGSNGILVWYYMALSRGFSDELGKALPELSGAAHILSHVKIDCQDNRYSQLRIIYYDKERKLMSDSQRDGKDLSPIANRPIPEDSAVDHLSKIVCKVYN